MSKLSPYPTPTIGGAMVKEGVDEYYDDEIYVWHQFEEDGHDLCLTKLEEDSVGEEPDWWSEDLDENIDYPLFSYTGGADRLKWAMERGVIHEQPFCIHITKPEWYRSSYEYEEYDMDYDINIVRIGKPRRSLSDFERVLGDIIEYPALVEKRHQENQKARWANIKRMYIQCSLYFTSGQSYCEMSMPNGVSYKLYSTLADVDNPKYFMPHFLAEGRSDSGDHDKAFLDLQVEVAREHPDVVSFLDNLHKRW